MFFFLLAFYVGMFALYIFALSRSELELGGNVSLSVLLGNEFS